MRKRFPGLERRLVLAHMFRMAWQMAVEERAMLRLARRTGMDAGAIRLLRLRLN
jgi:hypothetical protein